MSIESRLARLEKQAAAAAPSEPGEVVHMTDEQRCRIITNIFHAAQHDLGPREPVDPEMIQRIKELFARVGRPLPWESEPSEGQPA